MAATTLKDVPAGSYKLLVRFVGYSIIEREIAVAADQPLSLNINLEENQTELSEVVVVGEGDKESDRSVRSSEQKADNVQNIIGCQVHRIASRHHRGQCSSTRVRRVYRAQ